MALSAHETTRLKWLTKQLARLDNGRKKIEARVDVRLAKIREPLTQIEMDMTTIRNEIKALEEKAAV